jgi:site-specific recombinase XerD
LYLANSNWQFAIGSKYDDIHPVGAVIIKERVSDIPYMLAESEVQKILECTKKGI